MKRTTAHLNPSQSKGAQDTFIWLPTKSGEYNVKTGYHTARAQEMEPDDPHLHQLNWIKDVWSGKFSPKLIVFLWKIIQRALPLGDNLLNHGLDNVCCIHCGDLEAWKLAPTTDSLDPAALLDFTRTFLLYKNQVCLPPTGINAGTIFPWICWAIWSTKNHLIFEERSFSPEETILKAIVDAKEWQLAQTLEKPAACKIISAKLYEIYDGQITVFTDGSWNTETKIAGMGWTFKDKEIRILSGKAAEPFVASPIIAEALAIKSALIQPLELGFLNLHIKSDAPSNPSPNSAKENQGDLQSSF
ncbi:unnamed protein product [Microthlaspi erraticum]|uniref:RNase H type-1 domain-containing protein n=1 Tax=Microthlaspi erraticum TaxID=1685480 RepID=A0A6D2HPZ0_9BRAS|nr:unnamed protein product [Microthlaspi erraticum]